FIDETILASRLRGCPHLISVVGVSVSPLAQVIEFMSNGDLFSYISRTPAPPPIQLRFTLGLDISQALGYLHGHLPSIVHLDFKSPNVLLTEDPLQGRLIA